jgi:hypothetical protein
MARLSSRVSIVLACSVCLLRLAAAADDAPAYKPGEKIPLAESDLRAITLQVLATNPLLSSSPGIKCTEAWRSGMLMPSGQVFNTAQVVFYPHAASAGIKEAFQAQCKREISFASWTCDHVDLVGWGSADGQGGLTVEAHLRRDGNAATSEDWQTSILPPEEPQDSQ